MTRLEAEREAVRQFGPQSQLADGSWQRAFRTMVGEVMFAAVLLGGRGVVAVGLSGGIAAVMNALAGDSFVGAATVFGMGGHSVTESARDAVSLRVFAGVVGLAVLTSPATRWPGATPDPRRCSLRA